MGWRLFTRHALGCLRISRDWGSGWCLCPPVPSVRTDSLGEGKWQVSKDQGNWPEWRVQGEIVFNTAPSGTAAFAAPVNTSGTAFESGVPQRLPLPPSLDVVSTPQSSLDGQRFLVEITQAPRAPRTSISVVLNWPALLKR